MNTTRPFLDYYGIHDISPVVQDISDLGRHFDRRASLYRSLGIPPLYVHGRDVIEFGPGSGFNSLYTQYLGPRRYLMVDANPRGVQDTRSLMVEMYRGLANVEVVQALIEEFESPERFDLVLAEGLVPFQLEPIRFIRRIARMTAKRGVLVLTCADAPSIMGEIGRRLIGYKVAGVTAPASERLELLTPLFTPHLATLGGMSRSVSDWIHDNILIPFVGKTFGIDEAIAALDDGYDIYGTSPQFIVDLRWYKQLHGHIRRFNENASQSYFENMLNFLDYRVTVPAHDAELGRAICDRCRCIYTTMQEIEASDGMRPSADAAPGIREVAILAERSPRTASALVELANFLETDSLDDPNRHLGEFRSYFGRGMQYLSFLKRDSLTD